MVHEELEGKDVDGVEVRGSFMTRSMVSRRRVIIGDLAVGSGLKAKIDECVDECVGSGGREWRGGRQLGGGGEQRRMEEARIEKHKWRLHNSWN